MKQIIVAKSFQQGHASLAAQLPSLLQYQPGNRKIELHQDGDDCGTARAGTCKLVFAKGDGPAFIRFGSGLFALTYDENAEAQLCAAALAAAAEPGMPVCADSASLALLTLAQRVAQSEIPVLLEGPTGTGKEVYSRYLHAASARADKPFVAVNCAAMPEAMLEAMLFGHCKGSYTGASVAGEGFFRAADGGTLLLDEIGEMPLGLQAKLLRALQEGEVVPLGATQPVKVDVRVIACTNRNLPDEVAKGTFRSDLYYRLNVFPLQLAALRERRDDIAPLAFTMLLRHTSQGQKGAGKAGASKAGAGKAGAGKAGAGKAGAGRAPRAATLPAEGGCNIPWMTSAALEKLRGHSWPGNVRELENVIRRALLLAGDSDQIDHEDIVFDSPVRALPTQDFASAPQQFAPQQSAPQQFASQQFGAQHSGQHCANDGQYQAADYQNAAYQNGGYQNAGYQDGSAQICASGEVAISAAAPVEMPMAAPAEMASNAALPKGNSLFKVMRESEADVIARALSSNEGNRRKTAQQLGISERTLRYRLADMREAGMQVAGGRK